MPSKHAYCGTKEMHREDMYEDLEIVLNSYGEVDVEYYYQKARAHQAAALVEFFSSTGKGIVNRLHAFYEKYLCLKRPAVH